MAEQGSKIPQGLVLFVLGAQTNTPASPYSRGRRAIPTNINERHGALVPLPATYAEALQVALRYFGTQLSVSSPEDLVLKVAITPPHSWGGLVMAEFDANDWERVMVGPELEIRVFKSEKMMVDPVPPTRTPEYSRSRSPSPMRPNLAAPPPFICNNPANNPWLANYTPWGLNQYDPVPVNNKAKTIQLTHVTAANEEALTNGDSFPTALVSLPESYEDCERVAREIFNPPANSKMTMKVSSTPHNYTNYGKVNNWTVVHKSAYTTSILTFSGAFEIRVDFTGGNVERTGAGCPPETSSDTFLMI